MKRVMAVAALSLTFVLAGCSSSEVEVPNVVGQKADAAQDVLRDAGFYSIDLVEEDGDAVYVASAYTVLSQDPAAGGESSALDAVTLTVRNDAEARVDEKKHAESEAEALLAGMVNGSAIDAYDKLTTDGYSVQVLHAASKQDFSGEFEVDGLDWLISGYDGLDAAKKKVTIYIDTQEGMDQRAANDAVSAALEEKLPASYAWTAVKNYGDEQYPYGFKLHDIMGVLAETAQDENTWFLKASCDVTNEYGSKEKDLVCEAEVTGTKDNPEVLSFLVY